MSDSHFFATELDIAAAANPGRHDVEVRRLARRDQREHQAANVPRSLSSPRNRAGVSEAARSASSTQAAPA